MILRFKSKRNINGHRSYLAIDTEKKVFTTLCKSMITDGEEVTRTAINNIKKTCISAGYTEAETF